MTETPPPPPVPPDADLNGYGFMPLFGHQLFGSDFNARVSDAGWRAAVTLWWAAWNQVPAGSLPNDDVILCRLADLGRDTKTWKRVKSEALHGFEIHSDGRLYAPFLSKLAKEAWERRLKERARKVKYRAGRDAPGDGDKTGTSPSKTHVRNGREGQGEGQGEGEGQGQKKESYPEAPSATTSRATALIEIFDRVVVEVYGPERARAWPQAADAVHAQRAIDGGWTEQAAEALFRARLERRRDQGKGPPGGLAWFEQAFAEASPAERSVDEPSDNDPRVKAYVAAVDAFLALDVADRRKAKRPAREQFGLPPGPPAPKAAA